MLCVISPAKTLDFESALPDQNFTQPSFTEHSQLLIDQLRKFNAADISKLMKLSEKLAVLNEERYLEWNQVHQLPEARPAVLAFKGDVYTGMDAAKFSDSDFASCDKHLRILSGLYGLLKPLDLMRAYRLEMGTKLENERGKNLYEFWGNIITETLNAELEAGGHTHFVNLASNEYFKAVKKKEIIRPVIDIDFLDWKTDKYKIISFYAKKARGMMAAYIIQHDLSDPADLAGFNTAGYAFCPERSTENKYIFTRKLS